MTPFEWKQIHNFKKSENWGDPDLIKNGLVTQLDIFRTKIKTPIIISCGTQGEHAKNSAHHTGNAVDILFPEKEIYDLPDLFIQALRWEFRGIGIYPHWKYNGKIIGGMHLDTKRNLNRELWIGLEDKSYIEISIKNMNWHFGTLRR